LRSLFLALFVALLSASPAWSLSSQGALAFELRAGSEARFYQTGFDPETGDVLPRELGDVPIAQGGLSGTLDATREGQVWTVTDVAIAADDMSEVTVLITIGSSSFPWTVDLSDIHLTMPFVHVPDADGILIDREQIAGADDGSILRFDADADDEVDCAGCDDFAVSVSVAVNAGDATKQAVVGRVALTMGEEAGAITLGGTLAGGYPVSVSIPDVDVDPIALWLESDLRLLQVPEPRLGLLQACALLPLLVLARQRRRSRR